jgi:hypothetical protein
LGNRPLQVKASDIAEESPESVLFQPDVFKGAEFDRRLRVSILKESEFRKRLKQRGLDKKNADFTVSSVKEYEAYLKNRKTSFESACLSDLEDYVSLLIKKRKNSLDRLVALARYCSFAKKNDEVIYLVSLFGARNVLPDIGKRLEEIAGKKTRRKVFEGVELPPLGSPQEDYPKLTKKIVERMEAELPSETCREVLTWNYHNVPVEAFKEKKERFEKASSIDDFLKDEHRRFVEELSSYMKRGQVWYEQEITPEVLELVKGNQEIQNGVRQGNKIYVSKIPYAPKQFLAEKDPGMKRYYACHCQLVRTAIRDGKPKISPVFCYCSGGYEKLRFDVIFGEPAEIELLESVLKGDTRCRFAITIPKGKMK